MVTSTTISAESEKILSEIIDHGKEPNYWEKRFNGLTHREDAILRGCFKELKDKGLIVTFWASNCPYYVEVLKDGYLYEEHRKALNEEPVKVQESSKKISKSLSAHEYDVFISHANKDKISFVDDLKKSIDKLGVSVFYDSDSLEWGDEWKERILQGVEKAEFAIIVISENFFEREWTEKELNSFLSRQNKNGQKIILPILHNISISQLRERYPKVADIQTISSADYSTDEIALMFGKQLIRRLKQI